ncbi:MAG: calcium-binding protein, partial [Gemmatimonadaceae bacterium]|nr:calcium-binding protein [Acetobacteraceae bacterium]
GGLLQGGTAGNNSLLGGTGTAGTTMFGGGNGDQLFARGSGTSFLNAGVGNETLSGAGSTGNNYFFAGRGNVLIGGGVGNDTIFAGGGSSTVDGGAGTDLIAIVNGSAGGTVLLNGFQAGSPDRVQLQGYAAGEAARAVTAAGSSNTITLSDNTRITFGGVSSVTTTSFT